MGDAIRTVARPAAVLAGVLLVAGCGSSGKFARMVDPRYGVATSPRVVDAGQAVPKGGGVYRIGKPYTIGGQQYVPEENPNYSAEGLASWYGDDFHGRLTANGEVFDMESISAAHPTLPMPSYVRVTNLATHKSIVVRVNDRGPYRGNRVIDLSHRTATLLGFKDHGVARVRVEYVGRAPIEGTDDRMLVATLRHGQPAPAPSAVMVASAKRFVETPGGRLGSDVPVPGERPYRLGRDDNPAVARNGARGGTELSASRSAIGQVPTLTTAYAPSRADRSVAFISGRGLY
jgi:rare lipoprotein A